MPTRDDQLGAVFAINDAVVSLELFDAHTTYRHLANKLIRSYALDAMEQNEVTEVPDFNKVQAFVDSVRLAPRERFTAVGIGETVRLSSDQVLGAALEVGGSCIHLAAFCPQADTNWSDDIYPTRARMHRFKA
jgi:hypothetical protein